jgi:peptide/nickel transport system permease protein
MRKSPPVRSYPIPTRKYPPYRPIPVLPGRRAWYQMPDAIAGLVLLGLVLCLAILGPVLTRCEPNAIHAKTRLQGPTSEYPLGTDQFGRDVMCRTFYGGRVSLPVGLLAVATAVLPGLWLGLIAGYQGGWVDVLVVRFTDITLAFPSILLALLIIAWLGTGIQNAMIAVGLAAMPRYIRVVRANAARLERAWFVRAARIVGCTNTRILIRHILPNVLPAIIALATLDIGWAILSGAALSFLGLGAQPPMAEWGAMIDQGRGFLRQAPWIVLAPGVMMTVTVLAVNLIGDGLRDALDPRIR